MHIATKVRNLDGSRLDFVFASETIADRVSATALNQPAAWGGSDHCQVRIAVDL